MRNLAQVTWNARSQHLGPSNTDRTAPLFAVGIFDDHAAPQNAVLREFMTVLEIGELQLRAEPMPRLGPQDLKLLLKP